VLVVEGEGEGRLEVELALLVATGWLEDPDTLVRRQEQGERGGGVGVDEGDHAGVVLDHGEEVSPPGEAAASADMGGEVLRGISATAIAERATGEDRGGQR
jgi:hypothetical protein